MLLYAITQMPRWVGCILLAIVALILMDGTVFAASTTDVIELFRYTYADDRLAYIASEEIVMWNILKKKMAPQGGRGQWIKPIRTKNAGVFRGHTEGGAKTTRRSQPDTTEASFSLQEYHGIWDISWKMLQDARNDRYSFERAIEFMDESFRTRVFRLLNAELLGYGRGELGILPAADDQAAVTVRAMPMVDLGLIVDLMDASDDNTLLIDGQPVTAISIENREITTATTVAGSAAGDYYTVADTVSSSGSLHLLGLLAWVSNANPAAVVGNLGGIDRTTPGNDFWNATVLANGGVLRPLTEDLILQGMDLARERGGKKITDFLSNLALIRRYHETLREDVFFAAGSLQLKGGIGLGRDEDGMESGKNGTGETIYRFSGIPWRAEIFMDANRLVGIDRTSFHIAHGENEMPAPLSEIFDDNVPYFNPTSNTTFEVISYWQGELVCDAPANNFTVRDIAEV
jgi:hypothetical protein